MRIGVSARGLSQSVGGALKIVDEVLRRLPDLGGGHEIISYQPPGTPVMPGVTPVWVAAPHALWWEQVALPRALSVAPPDVLFAPKTLLPLRLPKQTQTVSLVLDLLYFSIGGHYLHEYRWQDIAYNRLFYRDSCRRATAIACISEQTRRDLFAVCPDLPVEKVQVVSLGVEMPTPEAVVAERIAAVRARHQLGNPYIFYAGSLSPRKNMVRGVRAFARLANECPHDLVVTAGKSWRDREVEAEVDRCGLRGRFRRLGVVAEDELPALYAGADVFFFPSLYEGFGLPVLEAMACGCPVVAANTSSIPEAADGAALLVDPCDVEAMTGALRRMLVETDLVANHREMGYRRAAACSWDRTVRALLEMMEQVSAS